uniref:Arrestin red cell n=1 Tax=Cyprinus carpio TaxID=7962 RepID=A0A8C1XL90_CYPCA
MTTSVLFILVLLVKLSLLLFTHSVFCLALDGVLLIDPEYLKDRKVFVTLTCAFRYGREDLDVLGLSFRKDLFISSFQAYPPLPEERKPLSRLQERLLKKLGQNAYPFNFTIPQNLPCSVTLQPGPEDTGKACGVDFEVRAFCAKTVDEKTHKRNSVRLVIRKVQYAPEKPGPQPMVETTRSFLMSDRSLHLEASLDKELYYHGEPISVNVHVTNNSTKTVKRVKISGKMNITFFFFFFQTWIYSKYSLCFVLAMCSDQVSPSSTFCKVYTLTPTLSSNREKRGLALDGQLKHEDTNLASSTIVKDVSNKEVLGILVSYRVKVKLVVSRGGDVSVELPFVLMHPKPSEQPNSRPQSGNSSRLCLYVCRHVIYIYMKCLIFLKEIVHPQILFHSKPVRPSFIFGTHIKIFLMKSESFLTLHRQQLTQSRIRTVVRTLLK